MPPHVVSVSVGRPRTVPRGSGTAVTAIRKEPLAARLLGAPKLPAIWQEWAEERAA